MYESSQNWKKTPLYQLWVTRSYDRLLPPPPACTRHQIITAWVEDDIYECDEPLA